MFRPALVGGSFAELLKGDGVHALGDANGFIVIRCVADEAEILTLGVLPARRRAGLARKLVRAAMELAATQYRVAHVFLEVGAENHGARDLYADWGSSAMADGNIMLIWML